MSADNRLCYMQWNTNQWFVWHGSCSEDYYEPPSWAQDIFATEEEALAFIKEEEGRIGYLEGGVTLVGDLEQDEALRGTIEDLTRRLENLTTKGHQYPNWIQ